MITSPPTESLSDITDLPPPRDLPKVRPDDAYRSGFFWAFGAATLALLLFLTYKLLGAIASVATPFVGAFVLALILDPLVRLTQARVTAGNRGRAVAIVFVIFLSVLIAGGSYAIPALVTQAQRLVHFFTPVTYTVTRSTGERDTKDGKERYATVVDGIPDTTCTVKNLVNGVPYQFVVYAVNADGDRGASPAITATPTLPVAPKTDVVAGSAPTPAQQDATAPTAPRSLSAQAHDGSVKLIWQPPAQGQSGFDKMRANIDRWLVEHPKVGPVVLPRNLNALTTQYSDQISHALKLSAGRFTVVALDSVAVLVNAVVIPIIAIFILSDIDRLRARLYLFLPEPARRFAQTTALDIGDVFGKYLRGLLTICSMYGAACILYLLAISLHFTGLRNYALLLGALGGVLYAVPYLGPILTVILAAITAFSTGGGAFGAFLAAGGVGLLNQIFDYTVLPRVIGKSAGLHPLLTMFALFLGNVLMGFWGMVLAVPLAASLQTVLFRLYPQLAAPTPLSLIMGERHAKVVSVVTTEVTVSEPVAGGDGR